MAGAADPCWASATTSRARRPAPCGLPRSRAPRAVRVTVIDYGPDHLVEARSDDVGEIFPFRDTDTVTWINVEGLQDVALLEALGQHFGLHPLTLEDVLNCGQRPKIEDYGTYQFVVMKSLALVDEGSGVEQISFILGKNYVLTFRRSPATPSRRCASASAGARG